MGESAVVVEIEDANGDTVMAADVACSLLCLPPAASSTCSSPTEGAKEDEEEAVKAEGGAGMSKEESFDFGCERASVRDCGRWRCPACCRCGDV